MRSLLLDASYEGASLLAYKSRGEGVQATRQQSTHRTYVVRPKASGIAQGQVSPFNAVLQLEVPQPTRHSPSIQPQHIQPSQQSTHPWTHLHYVDSSSKDHLNSYQQLAPLSAAVEQAQQQQQLLISETDWASQKQPAVEPVDHSQAAIAAETVVHANTAVHARSGRSQPNQQQQQQQQEQEHSQHLHSSRRPNSSSSSSIVYRYQYRLHITPHLLRIVQQRLAAGHSINAEQLLRIHILRIKSLQRLEAAIDKLIKADLLRPAVVIALLSQLRRIVAQQQQQQQQNQWQQQLLLARRLNRERQCRRRQHRLENQQRKEQEEAAQQAEAAAAANAQAAAERRAIRDRLKGRSSSSNSSRSSRATLQGAGAVVFGNSNNSGIDKQRQRQQLSSSAPQAGAAAAGKKGRRCGRPTLSRVSSRPSVVVAASRSSSPRKRLRQQPQQQQLQQQQSIPAATQVAKSVGRLQRRLITLVKAGLAGYSAVQLQLLQTCLMRLKVCDQQLWQQLKVLGLQQLPVTKPQKLVPLLVGAARAEAAAVTAAAASCTNNRPCRATRLAGVLRSHQQQQRQQQQMVVQEFAMNNGANLQHQQQQNAGHPQQQQYSRCERQVTSPAALKQPPQSSSSSAALQSQQQSQQQDVESPAQPQQTSHVVNQPSAVFVTTWLEASTPNLRSFTASQLALSIYSLALLKQQPPQEWLSAFFAASLDKLRYCSAQDLSNMLWAMATLQLQPPDGGWWSRFQVQVTAVLWSFTGVGIANLIWACAKLQLQPNPQLCQLLLWQAQRRFNSMDLKLIVSLAWGVAELGLKPQIKWLRYLTRRVTWLFRELTPSLAASLLLSLSSLHYCPRTWMKRFLAAVHPQLAAFSTRDISNTFTAFARMDYVPKDDWLFDFLLEARRAVPKCGTQELLAMLHALALLSNHTAYRVHPDFLAALLARSRVCAEGFSAQDCVNLAQSLVYLKVAPGVGVLAAVCERFSQGLAAAEAKDVAGMLWALGAFWRGSSECLWLRQHPEMLQQLVAVSQQHLEARAYLPLELKRVLAAVAAMAYNPGAAWLAAHEAAAVAQLEDLYPASVESLQRGYRLLGYQPQLLQQVLAQQQQLLQQQDQPELQLSQQQKQQAVANEQQMIDDDLRA